MLVALRELIDPFANRPGCDSGPTPHANLTEHTPHVTVHSTLRHGELACDFAIGPALRDETDNFEFTHCQIMATSGSARRLNHHGSNVRGAARLLCSKRPTLVFESLLLRSRVRRRAGSPPKRP